MMVITPKHVGAVLNFNTTPFQNLSISWCKNFDNIKMHGTTVKIIVGLISKLLSSNKNTHDAARHALLQVVWSGITVDELPCLVFYHLSSRNYVYFVPHALYDRHIL